ncbi:hypothetical protein PAXRUDRAFT_158789, partial [Paxillus rubicundulus Ve08.2h10]
ADLLAWKIICDFATSSTMTLPEAEAALQAHLGSWFEDPDWRLALKSIMDVEGVVEDALEAMDQLSEVASSCSGIKICIKPAKTALLQKPKQVVLLEAEMEGSVHTLKSYNHIFGTPLMVDKILDAVEERGVGDLESLADGNIEGIADTVWQEMAIVNGEIIKIEDNDNNVDDDSVESFSCTDLISLCQQLKAGCMQYGDPTSSFNLLWLLSKYCAGLHQEELLNATQTLLDSYLVPHL